MVNMTMINETYKLGLVPQESGLKRYAQLPQERVKRVHKAQPDEMNDDEEDAPAAVSRDNTDPELLDSITNQEEMDEAVNEWLFDLELEGLRSGLPRDVCDEGVVYKAPLSSIFGAP
ncbi:TPA: hypothetical protein ACH3X1_005170 [Trebouxia sp. C0004]